MSAQPPLPEDGSSEYLNCPISSELMTEPYFITECGHSF